MNFQVKEALLKAGITGVAAALTLWILQAVEKNLSSLLPHIEKYVSTLQLIELTVVSVLLNIVLLTLFFSELLPDKKTKFKTNYTFNDRFGFYEHKTNSNKCCPSCYTEDVESLMLATKHSWHCARKNCKIKVYNVDNPVPPKQPRPREFVSKGTR
jgi:hypothetical protein